MSEVIVRKEWAPLLNIFGDPQRALDSALRTFLLNGLTDRIESYKRNVSQWEEKFGGSYYSIVQKIQEDEEYVRELDQKNPIWESDLINWEYDQKELEECIQNLESVLTKS